MTTSAPMQFHFGNYPLGLPHQPVVAHPTPGPGPAGRGALAGMATGAVPVVATIPPFFVPQPEEWVSGAVILLMSLVVAAILAAGPGAVVGCLLGQLSRAPIGAQRALGALAAALCATPALLLLGLLTWPVVVVTMLCGLGSARWVAVGPRRQVLG